MALCVTFFSSCLKNNFDEPPVNGNDPNLATTHTIAELKALYLGTRVEITDSIVIAGIVVADDKSGNFYKTLVLQDSTAGISIRLDESGLSNNYMIGRRVYIKCKGLHLGAYNGLIQLGGSATPGSLTDIDPLPSSLISKFLVRGGLNNEVEPLAVTIVQLNNSHQNRLIKLENVQFVSSDAGTSYANGVLQTSKNVTVEDCSGNIIVMRNSGYATFANELMPTGKGTLYAIYSVFGNTKQLLIRDTYDVQFNENRCDGTNPNPGGGTVKLLEEKFDGQGCQGCTSQPVTAPLNLPGWSIVAEEGTVLWLGGKAGVNGSNPWAQCSAYGTGQAIVKTWMITPAINLDNTTDEKLEFRGTGGFDNGAIIRVYASSDYTPGNNPNTATWTELSFNALPSSTGNQYPSFASSGLIDLSGLSGNIHIGWQYDGGVSLGKTTTWEIDNIVVTGEQ